MVQPHLLSTNYFDCFLGLWVTQINYGLQKIDARMAQ